MPDRTAQEIFNDAYWKSFPPEIDNLRFARPEERESIAKTLSSRIIIDAPIMVWGWDPFLTMTMREWYGYTWVPSAFQPQVAVAPGLWVPGVPSYDPLNIPPGAVRVSTDPADYPPFRPPKPAPTPAPDPNSSPVGGPVNPLSTGVGSYWFSTRGEDRPADDEHTDSRGTFKKFAVPTIGGFSKGWTRIK